jgi:hypothetical protein
LRGKERRETGCLIADCLVNANPRSRNIAARSR